MLAIRPGGHCKRRRHPNRSGTPGEHLPLSPMSMNLLTIASLLLACAGTPANGPEEIVSEPYALVLPGVISADFYVKVRSRSALQKALDEQMLPALTAENPPAERIAAFLIAREAGLAADKEELSNGPPKIPTAEEIAAGPIGPRGDTVHLAFDRVSTDVLRTWFRDYSDWLSRREDVSMDQRELDLKALEAVAAEAIPWSSGEGESARVEVMLARAAMLER